jgi:hypothetical protein
MNSSSRYAPLPPASAKLDWPETMAELDWLETMYTPMGGTRLAGDYVCSNGRN